MFRSKIIYFSCAIVKIGKQLSNNMGFKKYIMYNVNPQLNTCIHFF